MELLAFLCGAGFVTLWLLISGRRDEKGWLPEIMAEEVVVHTRDDSSVRGILTQVTRHELVLSRAAYLQGERETELQGELGIPRANVAFVQRIQLTREVP